MTRSALLKLKGTGYLISTASVLLLAFVSWPHASESMAMTACLLGGAASSIIGMFFRWFTYEIEKRQLPEPTVASRDIIGHHQHLPTVD